MAVEDYFIAHARVSSKPHKGCKMDDKMTFFHQLATLISSGTPLLQAVQICSEQTQSLKLKVALEDIVNHIASGSSFHAAAANHTKYFAHHWIEVIRTGEITGQMSLVLNELNKQIHESRATRKKIVGAMTYPMILVCVSILVVTAMLSFVVPTFAKMFHDMGAELPGITQFVVNASGWISKYGIFVGMGVVGFVVGFKWYMTRDSGRRHVLGVLVGLPMVGELVVQMAMYQFCANISLLLKSGVPMLETLGVLENVFHTNPVYREALEKVHDRVAAGRPLSVSLEETGLFTTMITNMVRIGEGSGQLAPVMEQMAPYYKEKMESLIGKVTKLMEPCVIVFMGATVAGIMLSIYMPMFEMSGKVH
jgi:type IV pilus assembly protein PilC